ncbi:hypothetical protein HDU86_007499 [Geranomyces michiganensis]|nr:hypothetical protein HDU86_007499 [Geranomyces michiganensis]
MRRSAATASAVLFVLLSTIVAVHARICTYKGGQLYIFERFYGPNGTEMNLNQAAQYMGPLWTGFTYCNGSTISTKDSLEIVRPLSNSSAINLTILREGAAKPKQFKSIAQAAAAVAKLNSSVHNVKNIKFSAAFTIPVFKPAPARTAPRRAKAAARAIIASIPGGQTNAHLLNRGLFDWVGDGIDWIGDKVGDAADALVGGAGTVVGWVSDRAGDIANGGKDMVTDAAAWAMSGAVDAACKTKMAHCESINQAIQDGEKCRQDIADSQIKHRPPKGSLALRQLADVMQPSPIRRHVKRQSIDPTDPFYKCIPLVSRNPSANPYHPLLTGMADSAVRYGGGFPIRTGDNFPCTAGQGKCTYTKTRETTTAHTTSFTVTASDSQTFAKSDSESWNRAKEDSMAKAITDITDENWQKTRTSETSGSVARELSHTFTKAHEESVAKTHGTTDETSTANMRSWDHEQTSGWSTEDGNEWGHTDEENSQTNWNDESNWNDGYESSNEVSTGCSVGGNSGVDAKGEAGASLVVSANLNGGITGGITSDRNMNKIHRESQTGSTGGALNNGGFIGKSSTDTRGGHHNEGRNGATTDRQGGSVTVTQGHTESDSTETRYGDTVSDAWTDGRTETSGWNIGQTDANGGSVSHSVGTTSTRGITDSNGRERHTETGRQGTTGNETRTEETVTISRSDQVSQEFPAGTCLYSACLPQVRSTVIPWGCRGSKPDEIKILTSEVQQIQMNNGKPICNDALMPCNGGSGAFTLFDDDLGFGSTIDGTNVLRVNRNLNVPKAPMEPMLVSRNMRYKAVFLPGTDPLSTGSSFAILDGDTVIWQTGLRNLGGPAPGDDPSATMETRIRVTTDGHLVQEARNILIKNRNNGDWITVWSSVPRHLNYTVGVYGEVGYALVLQDDGKLVLRDGVGARIWSSSPSECTNAWGYKYPLELRFPLAYSDPEPNFPGQIDPHNEIPASITWIGAGMSSDACDKGLQQNQGFRSKNKRFSIYLTSQGNLVLKDWTRTMWESKTANMWFTEPSSKYNMILSDLGQLVIRDHKKRAVWQTYNNIDIFSAPYFFMVLDEGDAVITNGNGSFIWSAQPTPIFGGWEEKPLINNLQVYYPSPKVICYDQCGECKKDSDWPKKPLINLVTRQCLGPNGPAPCNGAPEQDFHLDEHYSLLRWSQNTSMCVGNNVTVLAPCTLDRGWAMYGDGSMNQIYRPYTCLLPSGIAARCENPRMDKRWSHGPRMVETVASNSTRVLLPGETLMDPASGATFNILPTGDFQLKHPKRPQAQLQRNALTAADIKKFGTPTLEVQPNGLMQIIDYSGKHVYKTFGQKRPSEDGPATRLVFNTQGLKVMLRTGNEQSTWNLAYP